MALVRFRHLLRPHEHALTLWLAAGPHLMRMLLLRRAKPRKGRGQIADRQPVQELEIEATDGTISPIFALGTGSPVPGCTIP